MDTAISLDINVYREAEREADMLRLSVPEFCSMAIKEFVKSNKKSVVTKQLDNFYSAHKSVIDEDIMQAQCNLLDEEDWEW